MRCFLALLICAAATPAILAQEAPTPHARPPLVIGVGLPVNVGVDIAPEGERNYLIAQIKATAASRKPAVAVEVVPLTGRDVESATDEAREHQCEFMVFTTASLQNGLATPTRKPSRVQSSADRETPTKQLSVQYSLTRPGETRLVSAGTALTPGTLDGFDLNSAMRSSLHDVAARVVHDLQKQAGQAP